jgi:hypothetical protein
MVYGHSCDTNLKKSFTVFSMKPQYCWRLNPPLSSSKMGKVEKILRWIRYPQSLNGAPLSSTPGQGMEASSVQLANSSRFFTHSVPPKDGGRFSLKNILVVFKWEDE